LLERLLIGKPWGEQWNGFASWIQLLGFSIVLTGCLLFYNVLKLCKERSITEDEEM